MRRLLVIWVAFLPLFACGKSLVPVLDLGQAWARQGPVIAPPEPLGIPECRPFLGGGWDRGGADGYRRCRAKRAELSCYLDRPRPLKLVLQGRPGRVNQTAVQVVCNKRPVGVLVFESMQKTFELEIPAEATLLGRNRITLVGAQGCSWRMASITPLGRPDASLRRRAGEIRLPYHSTVTFPLELQSRSRLALTGLQIWTAPGGPTSQGKLKITLLTEEPLEEHHWTLDAPGSLPLPAGRSALVLEALPSEELLPGQLGLILTDAVVEGVPAPPSPPPPPAAQRKAEDRPNIVLYLVDTLRADRLGCYGYEAETTPAFDALAADGVVFEQAWAEAPWTKPSVATILSGVDARHHGAVEFADRIHQRTPSLASLLQESGYHTVGRVANRWVRATYGFDKGFDSFELSAGEVAATLVNEACSKLEKRVPEQPFFLYLHTIDPHVPYEPPQAFAEHWAAGDRPFGRKQMRNAQRLLAQSEALNREPPSRFLPRAQRLYDGEVASNDAAFANLVEWLKANELYDNTLIVLVSDHGEEFMEHGDLSHVQSLYQELLRVPLVMKLPGQVQAGSRATHTVHHLDIAPTVLEWAGLAVPSQMSGTALGLDSPQGRLLYTGVDVGSARTVYQEGQRPYLYRAAGVRRGRYVLLKTLAARRSRQEPLELYDLEKDPQQKQNILSALPVTALHLEKKLDREPRQPSEKAPADEFQKDLRALMYVR